MQDMDLWLVAGVEGAGRTSLIGIWESQGKNVKETTLTKEDIEFVKYIKMQGQRIGLVYISLDTLEDHIARIENRVYNGGDGADLETVENQFTNRVNVLLKAIPLFDVVVFFDNVNGFNLVGCCCGDRLTVMDIRRRWFQELLDNWKGHIEFASEKITREEKIDMVTKCVMNPYRGTFEELAK